MAVQKQDDQHEHTFSNYVRIRDVVQKTCLRRWTIGRRGKRGSGISVLPARHDDDDIYRERERERERLSSISTWEYSTIRLKISAVGLPLQVVCLLWWRFVSNQPHFLDKQIKQIKEEWCPTVPQILLVTIPRVLIQCFSFSNTGCPSKAQSTLLFTERWGQGHIRVKVLTA